MRLIDADALAKAHCEGCAKDIQEMCKTDPVCASMIWVVEAPTVDAVEVVRCKDCKHPKLPAALTQKYGEPGTLTCHNWHSPCNKRNVKQDDFCSYGERRNND